MSEELKEMAAGMAAGFVEDGIVLGLGTGSTVYYLIKRLGVEKRRITVIPTSRSTEELARRYGIKVGRIGDFEEIDLAIDGADEIDKNLNLTKGMGGALYREKMVANMSNSFIVIADESKLVERLGEKAPLPVEVLPFGCNRVMKKLQNLGCECCRRDFITDNGNFVVDCYFKNVFPEPLSTLSSNIKNMTGVVEHGLFLGITKMACVGKKGGVEILKKRV